MGYTRGKIAFAWLGAEFLNELKSCELVYSPPCAWFIHTDLAKPKIQIG